MVKVLALLMVWVLASETMSAPVALGELLGALVDRHRQFHHPHQRHGGPPYGGGYNNGYNQGYNQVPASGRNGGTAVGVGNANAANGNAQATGTAVARAPPGGFAASIGTSIAISTPFRDFAFGNGRGVVVG